MHFPVRVLPFFSLFSVIFSQIFMQISQNQPYRKSAKESKTSLINSLLFYIICRILYFYVNYIKIKEMRN